jgi:hypothetical protein
LVVLILLLHFPTLWVVLVIWYYLVASKGGWMGVEGGGWGMISRWPYFRPLGLGLALIFAYICSVDSTQSLGDVVPHALPSQPPYFV